MFAYLALLEYMIKMMSSSKPYNKLLSIIRKNSFHLFGKQNTCIHYDYYFIYKKRINIYVIEQGRDRFACNGN